MTDFKCNSEMTTQSQSQSSIVKSPPPEDSVTKIARSSNDVTENQASKIQATSADDLDSFVVFTRRYGKTYSPYGNIGPVVRKFGKTYSSRGNIKNANVESRLSTETEPEKHGKPISAENSTVSINLQSCTLEKVSVKDDHFNSKKLNVKNPSKLKDHLKRKDLSDLAVQNEQLSFPETLSQVNLKNKIPLKYLPQSGPERHIIAQSKSLCEENANATINLKLHTPEENNLYYTKKTIISNSSKWKGHFKNSNDLITEKLKLADDKAKRVIFLKKSVRGKPIMTFHLMPHGNTSTISPVRHASDNERPNSTGDKTPLKYQRILADKNSVSDSETLVDQVATGSFDIRNKSHPSHIKNIFPVSASRKDKDSSPVKLPATPDSPVKSFDCRPKKNLTFESTQTPVKTQPLSELSFVDASNSKMDKLGMFASEGKEFEQFDHPSQMNAGVRSKNLDSTSTLPVSVCSEVIPMDMVPYSDANDLKSPQKVFIIPKTTKDMPSEETKEISLPAEEISVAAASVTKMKSLEAKKKLKRLKKTSKMSSSDTKSCKLPKKLSKTTKKIITNVQSDCCLSVSENSTISGISNALNFTPKADESEKFSPSSQLLTENLINSALEENMKKTKLKPVPTEQPLGSVDCPSLVNAGKTGKKSVKEKTRILSNKQKLSKKMKLLKSEKRKIMSSKKKVKLSNLFLNDADKVFEKTIKSQFIPTLEKFEPILKERHSPMKGSENISTDDVPMVENATKVRSLGEGHQKTSGFKKHASASMCTSKSTNTELVVLGKRKKIKSKKLSSEIKSGKKLISTKGKTKNGKSLKMSTGEIVKKTKLSEKLKTPKSSSDIRTRKHKLSESSVDDKMNRLSSDVKKKPSRIATKKSKLCDMYNEMPNLSELSFVTSASMYKCANFSPDKLEMPKLTKFSPIKSPEKSEQPECPALFRALELMKKFVDTTNNDKPEQKATVAKSELTDLPELEKLDTKPNLASSAMPISLKTESITGSSSADVPSTTPEGKFTPSSQEINIQKPLSSACISSTKLSETPDSSVKTSVCEHKKNLAFSSTPVPIKTESLSELSFVDTPSSKTDKSNKLSQQIEIQKPFSSADESSATVSVTAKSIGKTSDCHHKKILRLSSTPISSITEQILEPPLTNVPSHETDRNIPSSSQSDTQNTDRNIPSSSQSDTQKPVSQVSISCAPTSTNTNSRFDNLVKPGSLVSGTSKKLNEYSKLSSPATTQSIPMSLPNFQSQILSKTSDKDSLVRSNVLLPPTNVLKPSLPSVCTSATPNPVVTYSDCPHDIKIVSSYSISTNSYDSINSICKTSTSNKNDAIPLTDKIHPVKTDNLVSERPVKLLVPASVQSTPISLPNFQSQTFLNNTSNSSIVQPNVLVPQINNQKASLSPVCTSVTRTVNPNSAVNKFVCEHKKNLTLSTTPIPIKTIPLSKSCFVHTSSSKMDKRNMLSQEINIQKPLPSACISSAKLSVTPDSIIKTSVCKHKKNLTLLSTPKTEPFSESSFVDTPTSKTDESNKSSEQIDVQKPFSSANESSKTISITSKSIVKKNPDCHKKNLPLSAAQISLITKQIMESSFVDTPSNKTDKNTPSSPQIDVQKPLSQVNVSLTTTSVSANSGFDNLVKPSLLLSKPKKCKKHTKLLSSASSSNLNNSGKTPEPVVEESIPLSNAKTNVAPLGFTNVITANSACLKPPESATVSTDNFGMKLTPPPSHDIKIGDRDSAVSSLAEPITKVPILPKRDNMVKQKPILCNTLARTHSVEGMELCSKPSVENRESTVMPSKDNVPTKSTSSANCTSLNPMPHTGLESNDSAAPLKPPSVSVSASSLCSLATPSSAKMGDTSSSLGVSPAEPKLKSNERWLRKKPFKMKRKKLPYQTYKKHLSCGRTSVTLCTDCNYPFTHCHELGVHHKSDLHKKLRMVYLVRRRMNKGKILRLKSAARNLNNQSTKKVTSIYNDNVVDPNQTVAQKSSEGNKKFIKLSECKSTNLLRINRKKPTLEMVHRSEKVIPETAHCSEKVIPETAHCSEKVIPETAHCSEKVIPETAHCSEKVIPETAHCSEKVIPETIHCSKELTPEMPRCLKKVTPEMPRCLKKVTPEMPHCLKKVTPEIPCCLKKVTPEMPCCLKKVTPKMPCCLKKLTPEMPCCLKKLTPETPRCSKEPTPETPHCSKEPTPEKTHCSKKVRKSFKAIDSSEIPQKISDFNSLKPNFVKTQPAPETISSGQELGVSDLSPPMLSPQNISPTSATDGDESLGSPLQMEDPPFLSKVQNPNENLNFSSGFLKLQADVIISKLVKEDPAEPVSSSCPEISTAASIVDGVDIQKEKDILVENVKKSDNLEKTDDLSSETFHQQERIIFLSNNDDDPNFLGNFKSMQRVGSPQTIVQCSMKDEPSDTNSSKESVRDLSETSSTKDSETTYREILLKETTTKGIAKTCVGDKDSGTSKSPNSSESLPQLQSPATDNQCSDLKDLSIKSNLVLEKPKPDSELPLKPVRCVPKRNYKKPQKYFCVDFDTSGWTGGKMSSLSPVVTSSNTLSQTNSNPAKSQSVTCELSKGISSKTKGDFSEKNKTSFTNNKVNDNNLNTITANKSNIIDNKNNCNAISAKANNDKVNDKVNTSTIANTTASIKNKNNDINNKNDTNTNSNELEESEKNLQKTKRQCNSKNKKIKEETTVESKNWNKELQKKKFLRLRFKDFIPRLYDNGKLAKKLAEEQTDSQQIPVENCSRRPESVARTTTSSPHDQKLLLPAIKKEWDSASVPTKTWREELVDNVINYTSVNSDSIEKESGNTCQIKSEECNVHTEPIQLSKLLGNPQTAVSSPVAMAITTTAPTEAGASSSYPTLPFPVIAPNTLCVPPSVPGMTTFLPVTNMDATNNMTVPLIYGNTMPVFTHLGNNQVFIGNLIPMPIVPDQNPVCPQVTTVPEPKTTSEETINFCPELKIKKEVVANDDEYGGQQSSDSAFGLRITGVAGNVTTHNTIPMLPNAVYSNVGSVDSHGADQGPKKQVVIQRRSLQCTLLQTVDSFGASEFLFECCGSPFSTSHELASHIDLCHP